MKNAVSSPTQDLYIKLEDARIMMIDDEPVLMDILEVFLEERGYSNFSKVEDSREAIDVMLAEPPDILLLDLKMPYVDGIQILQEVRSNRILERIPVIVLTSSSDSETKLQALELGATDFLAKPVDSSELALRLRNSLTIKAYQDQLTYYDALTKLPNRKLFIERLDWQLKTAERQGQQLALINIGLDRFNQINTSLGPAVGDKILQEVTNRLRCILVDCDKIANDPNDSVMVGQLARLGGDEFALLIPGANPRERAGQIAAEIKTSMQGKFSIDLHEIYVSASVGIAVYPEHGDEEDRLIKNASAATEHAKAKGRGCSEFYSKELNDQAQKRIGIEAELRRAVDEEEFVLHYQPKVDSHTGLVKSCEALIRWNHPERGLIYPDGFISIAEDTGLIIPMGEWVVREACRQQVSWCDQGVGDMVVSVNVSGPQFHTENLKHVIQSALSDSGMESRRLKLEITESMLMGDAEGFIRKLHEIRAIGPTFSIDDFGTGYSSLSYLKRFPIDELKIDRSFIVDVPAAQDDRAIVRAIIAMAHSLDLKVVAEGVEHAAQVEFLKSLNCDVIQGYFFSQPLVASDFARYVSPQGRAESSRASKGLSLIKSS